MKKHIIFLGSLGLIYYSWLVLILLISLIIAFEGNKAIVWPAVYLGLAFIAIATYTFLTSYVKETREACFLKLPYRKKKELSQKPKYIKKWWIFKIYQLEISKYEILTFMVFSKKG